MTRPAAPSLIAAFLAACGVLSPPEAEVIELELGGLLGVRADGPLVEVWRGEVPEGVLQVAAFHSTEGDLCWTEAIDGETQGFSCDLLPERGAIGPIGSWSLARGAATLLYAVLDSSASSVAVSAAGQSIDAQITALAALDLDETVMTAVVQAGDVVATIEAFDESGASLGDIEIGPLR